MRGGCPAAPPSLCRLLGTCCAVKRWVALQIGPQIYAVALIEKPRGRPHLYYSKPFKVCMASGGVQSPKGQSALAERGAEPSNSTVCSGCHCCGGGITGTYAEHVLHIQAAHRTCIPCFMHACDDIQPQRKTHSSLST